MRGAPITVGCDCGRVEYVAYGASWECPDCHRRYNTEQIPAEEYWGIMHEMRRYRLQVLAVSLFMGIGFAIVIATVDARRFLPLALVLMAFWFLIYMPRWRQKVRRRARSLPRWQLTPE